MTSLTNSLPSTLGSLSRLLADEEATIEFGKALAMATRSEPAALASPDQGAKTEGGILHLQGDLGAGKTTFTRGFLRAYGHEGAVKSPTYTLVEPYEMALCNIYHFDLYRLADPEEFEFLGAEQYFEPQNLCLIEWAEQGAGWVPKADVLVELRESGPGREVLCTAFTPRGAEILDGLNS